VVHRPRHPQEAVRHAQAAGEWALAARLLADHWPGLQLNGQTATVHALLGRFPARSARPTPSWRYWPRRMSWRRDQSRKQSGCSGSRNRARRRSRQPAAPSLTYCSAWSGCYSPGTARTFPRSPRRRSGYGSWADTPDSAPLGLSEDLRALALVNLGITEYWGGRVAEAEPHLEQGTALARRIGRPYLEFIGLAHLTSVASVRTSLHAVTEERSRQTIELARQHGWTDEPAAGIAYIGLAAGPIWRREHEAAAGWVRRAERTLRTEAEPRTAMADPLRSAPSWNWRAAVTRMCWRLSRPPSGCPGCCARRTGR